MLFLLVCVAGRGEDWTTDLDDCAEFGVRTFGDEPRVTKFRLTLDLLLEFDLVFVFGRVTRGRVTTLFGFVTFVRTLLGAVTRGLVTLGLGVVARGLVTNVRLGDTFVFCGTGRRIRLFGFEPFPLLLTIAGLGLTCGRFTLLLPGPFRRMLSLFTVTALWGLLVVLRTPVPLFPAVTLRPFRFWLARTTFPRLLFPRSTPLFDRSEPSVP